MSDLISERNRWILIAGISDMRDLHTRTQILDIGFGSIQEWSVPAEMVDVIGAE